MPITCLIAILAAAALLAIPSVAVAAPADQAAETPGPDAPAGEKAKAYGKHCQDQSKKHIAGQKGTAFSTCVTAMAKVATGREETSPRAACAPLSHKHKAGTNGTPFSRCVAEARELADQPAGA